MDININKQVKKNDEYEAPEIKLKGIKFKGVISRSDKAHQAGGGEAPYQARAGGTQARGGGGEAPYQARAGGTQARGGGGEAPYQARGGEAPYQARAGRTQAGGDYQSRAGGTQARGGGGEAPYQARAGRTQAGGGEAPYQARGGEAPYQARAGRTQAGGDYQARGGGGEAPYQARGGEAPYQARGGEAPYQARAGGTQARAGGTQARGGEAPYQARGGEAPYQARAGRTQASGDYQARGGGGEAPYQARAGRTQAGGGEAPYQARAGRTQAGGGEAPYQAGEGIDHHQARTGGVLVTRGRSIVKEEHETSNWRKRPSDELLMRCVLLDSIAGSEGITGEGIAGEGIAGEERERQLLSGVDWNLAVKHIFELHRLYTGRGKKEYQGVENPLWGRELGYQLYYLPRNLHRVRCVLRGLPWFQGGEDWLLRPWLRLRDGEWSLSWLDLGCGTGAFSLAWLQWLAGLGAPLEGWPSLHITLVDQSHRLLDIAERQIRLYVKVALPAAKLRIVRVARGIAPWLESEAGKKSFCLVGVAMSLTELGLLGPRRKSERSGIMLKGLQERVSNGGLMLFVEPGVRKGYLNLMMLHPWLRKHPILYPCPHQQPCPMWHPAVRNWCHATEILPRHFFFDEPLQRYGGLQFNMRDVNLSALAVQNTADSSTPPFRHLQAGERVVSGLMPFKQAMAFPRVIRDSLHSSPLSKSCLVCTANGKLRVLSVSSQDEDIYRGAWLRTSQK